MSARRASALDLVRDHAGLRLSLVALERLIEQLNRIGRGGVAGDARRHALEQRGERAVGPHFLAAQPHRTALQAERGARELLDSAQAEQLLAHLVFARAVPVVLGHVAPVLEHRELVVAEVARDHVALVAHIELELDRVRPAVPRLVMVVGRGPPVAMGALVGLEAEQRGRDRGGQRGLAALVLAADQVDARGIEPPFAVEHPESLDPEAAQDHRASPDFGAAEAAGMAGTSVAARGEGETEGSCTNS